MEVIVGMEQKDVFWEIFRRSSWNYLVIHCYVGMREKGRGMDDFCWFSG